MSDDEESIVRRRLSRLVDPAGEGHPPVTWPHPSRVPGEPSPGVGDPTRRVRAGARRPAPWPGAPEPTGRSASWPGGAGEQDQQPAIEDDPDRADPPVSRLPGPGAFDPGRRGVRALAVVAVLVVLGAGFWSWRSRPRAEPVRPEPASAASSAGGPSAAAVPAADPGGELVVAVAGKVRRPGLVRVPAGARVADAVEAAGGALPGVDVALLNPARKVADGELILVGVAAPPGQAGPAGASAGGAAPTAGGRLNLNTATLAQLDALPGVGPVLAQRILTHRDQQGGFRSVGDLRQVEGIGDARYEQLKDLVTV
ncbi:helix-hairpin-helix domain-containing protein [Micromonospora sp. CPCC 205711]|uniref:helix-hairpin-helix domain-containing protein n=1 Tax=Micromonospora sp. CPCC 205547 TaxID=3122400 RepID=UPI002FF26754